MLPAIPSTFGRLSDVFASSLGAITGADNRLGLKAAKRSIVVMVDGLGSQNLKAGAGHAPTLQQALNRSKPISCGFPSTTATSLTSFGTGVMAGLHGFVGYKLLDRSSGKAFNLLNGWEDVATAEAWQPRQTIAQRAQTAGIASFFIGPKAYEGSAFTAAIMRGTEYLAGRTMADRFEQAAKLLASHKEPFICYLYVPELDQVAHAQGSASHKWLTELEELDSQVRQLTARLGKGDGLLLTADHGIVDVPNHKQVYLDALEVDWSLVCEVAGEPRVNFVYLKDSETSTEFAAALQESIGDVGLALTRQTVIDAGWYGDVTQAAMERMPDIFVLATKNVAFYHRDFAPAASLNMIGQHGGLSSAEMTVPLLSWGAFA